MNGKYYWLKLKKDFFKRHDIRIIEAMPNGKDYILFYLKLLVESVDHEGNLRFSDTIPYNAEMLSVITNTNIDIVKSALTVFTELKMIDVLDDSTIYMNEVSKMIGSAADNDNAIRQQRFRDNKKASKTGISDVSVTKSNASVTECVTESNESKSIDIEKEKDIEIDKDKQLSLLPVSESEPVISPLENRKLLFEQFWKAYPKCKRKVNKDGCEKKFIKIPNLEKIFPDILASLEMWKKDWSKDNYEYVPMPSKWINQEYWTVTDMRTERQVTSDNVLGSRLDRYTN